MFQKKYFTRFLFLVVLLLSGCSEKIVTSPNKPTQNAHLTLGNPSGAGTRFDNYLLEKPQYALSYNNYRGTPNWVSWHLSSAWLGDAPRQDNFRADNSLPDGFFKAVTSDYTGSGFNRGHNCPSADRTLTEDDNAATFLMTNIIPQAPENNQRTWAELEDYCRQLVEEGNELYIMMGCYGKGGEGSNGFKETLAEGKITVPNRIWKVIVVLPLGTDDAKRVTTSTRVIAVDTPNFNAVDADWSTYRTTVDAIEKKTGYNLLSSVSTAVQNVVEARTDDGPTE